MRTLTFPIAAPSQETVTVKLWEIYLMYHPAGLYRLLTENSIDNGPSLDETAPGRIIFRFERGVWEDSIRDMLYEYRVPVVIHSNPLNAVRVKGRQPMFR